MNAKALDLAAFLESNGVAADALDIDFAEQRRFLRINPRFKCFQNSKPSKRKRCEESSSKLGKSCNKLSSNLTNPRDIANIVASHLKLRLQPVNWLPRQLHVFSIPMFRQNKTLAISSTAGAHELTPSVSFARCALSRKDLCPPAFHGIDASSCAAVVALGPPPPGSRVLDLCCAPGGKLCLMADLMQQEGLLVGVDVCIKRLHVARKMLIRSQAGDQPARETSGADAKLTERTPQPWVCKVFCADGTSFNFLPREAATGQYTSGITCVFDSVERASWPAKMRKRLNRNKSFRSRIQKLKKHANKRCSNPISAEMNPQLARARVVSGGEDNVSGERAAHVSIAATTADTNAHCASPKMEALPSLLQTQVKATAVATAAGANQRSHLCSLPAYSHVLVDAECTHDGSLRHLQRYQDQGWS